MVNGIDTIKIKLLRAIENLVIIIAKHYCEELNNYAQQQQGLVCFFSM